MNRWAGIWMPILMAGVLVVGSGVAQAVVSLEPSNILLSTDVIATGLSAACSRASMSSISTVLGLT